MAYDLVILSHHKCATNWLRSICDEMAKKEIINIEVKGGKASKLQNQELSHAKNVLLNVSATNHAYGSLRKEKARNIHFVRDPRDALVSNYFSWRYSHKINNETILNFREKSKDLSIEDGMIWLLDDFPMGKQLSSWNDEMWSNTTLFRYEVLLGNFDETLAKMFSSADVHLSQEDLDEVKLATSFSSMAGRDRGEEDKTKHFRKGVPGDWKNYETPALRNAFYDRYGWLGKQLGYWSDVPESS